jgi:hypothetical protein
MREPMPQSRPALQHPRPWRAWCLGVLLSIWAMVARAAETDAVPPQSLNLSPSRCIALHQGQACSQVIDVRWQLPSAQAVCLWETTQNTRLICWESATQGHFRWTFKADAPRQLQLRSHDDSRVLVDAWVDVAWVYKSNTRRQSQWRLF